MLVTARSLDAVAVVRASGIVAIVVVRPGIHGLWG
jgi:hypothetical protein